MQAPMFSTGQDSTGQLSPTQISQRYRYWRPRLLISMVIGYATFYLTRKSINFVMPVMQLELGLSKGDIGLLGTLFYLCYGASKFISGIVCDRSQVRWFMGVGLMITGGAEHSVHVLPVAHRVTDCLGAERVLSGMGLAPLRQTAEQLVFAQ